MANRQPSPGIDAACYLVIGAELIIRDLIVPSIALLLAAAGYGRGLTRRLAKPEPITFPLLEIAARRETDLSALTVPVLRKLARRAGLPRQITRKASLCAAIAGTEIALI